MPRFNSTNNVRRAPLDTGEEVFTASELSDAVLDTGKFQIDPVFNLFKNPSGAICQPPPSFLAIASDTYIQDRWRILATNDGTVDVVTAPITAIRDVGGVAPINSIQITVATADAAIGAAQFLAITTGFIDTDVATYYNRTVTVSFQVESNVLGIFTVSIQNDALDASYLGNFTINQINTVEKKTVTLLLDTTQGSPWASGTTRKLGTRFVIGLAAGTNFQGNNNAWNAGNLFGTAQTSNFLSNVGNQIKLSAFKFEDGNSASAYVEPGFNRAYQDALYYYQQTYAYGVAPGTVTNEGSINHRATAAAANLFNYVKFDTMREAPTLVLYSTDTGASGNVRNSTTAADIAVSATPTFNDKNYSIITLAAAPAINNILRWHHTARSEIV